MALNTYGQSNLGLPGADANGNHATLGVGHNEWPAQTLDGIQLWQGDDYTMQKINMVCGAQPSDPAGVTSPMALDPYIGADSGAGSRQPSQPPVSGEIGSTDLY